MRTVHTIFIAAAFLASVLTACQNPSDRPVKGNHKKDYKDTVKKSSADSAASQPRVDPGDTVRKY
ncbi:curli biogenesis system outer membrane secretion channel CsgG [Pedobacter sp. W3I1]|uniref:hypothetical protein n=1 Tax=Pedobacter sp. W3I1 TaxID=3042291 RepID=UPI002780DE92|nr:hypothetical protein [Pedobacter sp. W3I1]MDQ0641122.1 curli biogenesis system outer membrane secretion channel CsgG [Pedobacter sp. W3I1]